MDNKTLTPLTPALEAALRDLFSFTRIVTQSELLGLCRTKEDKLAVLAALGTDH